MERNLFFISFFIIYLSSSLAFPIFLRLEASPPKQKELQHKPYPKLDQDNFQDFLPLKKQPQSNFFKLAPYRRRYIERKWQEIEKQNNNMLFLEYALQDQFGTQILEPFQVKESPSRRFQIIFFLSLPITALYSYSLGYLGKNLSQSNDKEFNQTENLGILGLALAFSSWIAWYDSQNTKTTSSEDWNSF